LIAKINGENDVPKVSAEHKLEVKETIIKAAVKNFGKYGYANTKMDDIAEAANVSKGTLYLYFPNKEEMFQYGCKQDQQNAIKEGSELFRNKKNLESDLAEFYDTMHSAGKEAHSFRIEALSEAIHNPKLKRILDQNRRKFVDIVTEFCKQMSKEGKLFQKKEDLRTIAAGMCALWLGLETNRVVGTSHEENKDVWVKTMMAIIFGSGN